MYSVWLKVGCWYPQYNSFMIFCDLYNHNSDKYIALNINFSDLGYYSARKCADTLCVSSCTVVPTTTYILLRTGWYIGNVKI